MWPFKRKIDIERERRIVELMFTDVKLGPIVHKMSRKELDGTVTTWEVVEEISFENAKFTKNVIPPQT